MTDASVRRTVLVLGVCLFATLGILLVPHVGLEIDEVLFADPLYLARNPNFDIGLFHWHIPLMVMS
jgi:hypothetical protein